ncbi:MAG: hypothetical protein IBX55_16475 [Methyloprofundus sp.]|nr:hypothetical protein [Methyloprofundus sp.]
MADMTDTKTRSYIMSQVHNKNTGIEVAVRKALFAKGFRYKITNKKLHGSPKIDLPEYRAVINI